MDPKTQSLDRLLQVLSPALAAELDRVVQEASESLENDFKSRLQTAIEEAQALVQMNAAEELNRAVAEAIEATRKQVTGELEQKFAQRLAETTNQLQVQAAEEHARIEEQLAQWKTFADTPRELGEASSQPEILARFLRLVEPFAKGLAVYVAKSDGLALWKSRGKAAFPEIISQETTDPESYFRTIVVRGRTVAAISAAAPFKPEALDFFGASLERAIESFGLKLKNPVLKGAMSEKTIAVAAASGTESNPGDEKAHAEARRTARLLVSEIKLYHEPELQSGRQNSDIYRRLQKEIDRGREMYQHRVSGAVPASHDYFHEELVRILGENDPSRLGPAYPGPINS
ncbi:MAG TPA: hypothetical protein VGK48_18200 [Terriglobia bacterium]|jgi:hypothetical protein